MLCVLSRVRFPRGVRYFCYLGKDAPSRLDSMMSFNKQFVTSKLYSDYEVHLDNKSLRCVVVTCMDSRLTHLLPAALNIKQGEAKIIKTAGAIIAHPFGGIMRSILLALYELRATEVFVIGHDDCGMRTANPSSTLEKMVSAGVPRDRFDVIESSGFDLKKWLSGFSSLDDSVINSANIIRRHPLVPADLKVHGLIINPSTGAIRQAKDAEHVKTAGALAAEGKANNPNPIPKS
jgi:carbonic anhydrase